MLYQVWPQGGDVDFLFATVLFMHTPLMELPPLSPGIQDSVMDVVVVLVTVRRG